MLFQRLFLRPLEGKSAIPSNEPVTLMTTRPNNKIKTFCLSITCATLTACGGGGGGAGSGGDSVTDSAYGVRVLHASVDAAPVDVISSAGSSAVVSQQFFAGEKGYRSLPGGSQVLSLTKTLNPADVLATFSVDASSASRYSILFYGDLQNLGLGARIIKDEVPEDIAGAAIRVVNGVVGATTLQVSITSANSQLVGFGQNSEYIAASAGEVRVAAHRAADGSPAGSLVVNTQAGRAYTVLFAGEVGFYIKAVLFNDR